MKILAIICHNENCDDTNYGYEIWKNLKEHFHIYLQDKDIGNVYHHLNDLCELGMLQRGELGSDNGRCPYKITDGGLAMKDKFEKFVEIIGEDNKHF